MVFKCYDTQILVFNAVSSFCLHKFLTILWLLISPLIFSFHENYFTRKSIFPSDQYNFQNISRHYDRSVWPVNHSMPVDVTFGLELIHLVNVDERNHQITTNVWVRQSWTNTLLQWNTTKWNGIKVTIRSLRT